MAKPDGSQQLKPEQYNAIGLLMQGKSDREVAEEVGVSRQTVCHWRNNHPAFVAELNQRMKDLWADHEQRLRNLVGKAVDVLAEDMDSEDRRLRQAAAVHVLRSVGLYGHTLQPKGLTDVGLLSVLTGAASYEQEGGAYDYEGLLSER